MGFEEASAATRAAAEKLSRAEALARLSTTPHLTDPRATSGPLLLALASSPSFSLADRARCNDLHQLCIREVQMLVRPGTVEDLWYVDGLLDRLLRP